MCIPAANGFFVRPNFLLVDEDWPPDKPLDVVVCANAFSEVQIIEGNAGAQFAMAAVNHSCGSLTLNKPLDADVSCSGLHGWGLSLISTYPSNCDIT